MNVILFDKPQHLIQFETAPSWVARFFQCPKLLGNCPTELRQKIESLQDWVADRTLTNYNEIDFSDPKSTYNVKTTLFTPDEDASITVIDCVNKTMVSLNTNANLDWTTYNDIEEQLSLPTAAWARNKEFLENYAELLEKNYVLVSGNNPELSTTFAGRIRKYLATHKKSATKSPQGIQLTVNPATTGWSIHSSHNYFNPQNYQKIVECFWANNIELTPAQEKEWHDFGAYMTEENIEFKFFEAHRIEKEQEILLSAIKAPLKNTEKSVIHKI